MRLEATGPNAEQIRYWNERSGPRWVSAQAHLDALLHPLGLAVMERAGLREGERVLDVGCGCGQTLLQLAERVGPSGSVTGLDVSARMLSRARERVRAAGLSNVEIENADAQTFAASDVDLVFSRFGTMFFADPVAAFANLRRSLRPGGRLAFVCWQGLERNPWMRVPLAAVAPHLELGSPPAPEAPGPFAFADPERVRRVLEQAGFGEVALEALDCELALGAAGDLEEAVELALGLGPIESALAAAAAGARDAAVASLREALAPFATPRGVRMASATWVATARGV